MCQAAGNGFSAAETGSSLPTRSGRTRPQPLCSQGKPTSSSPTTGRRRQTRSMPLPPARKGSTRPRWRYRNLYPCLPSMLGGVWQHPDHYYLAGMNWIRISTRISAPPMPAAAARKLFTRTPFLSVAPNDPHHQPDGGHVHHRTSDDTDLRHWPGSGMLSGTGTLGLSSQSRAA